MPFLFCVDIFEFRTVSFGKDGFGVFFQFPIGDLAFFAGPAHPFIADPARGAAGLGVADHKSFPAMGGDFGEFAFISNGTDAVEGTVSRGPKFDLFQQAEKIDVFSVITFVAFCGHNINSGCHISYPLFYRRSLPMSNKTDHLKNNVTLPFQAA
jgi:hypothetical protein